jgi:hypothetical protein
MALTPIKPTLDPKQVAAQGVKETASTSVEPATRVATLGGVEVQPLSVVNRRLSMLVWGPSGAGKTTLLSTLPGKKLWINFDPDGTSTLGGEREDIVMVDYSNADISIVEKFRDADPMRIGKFIIENEITSIIFDSLTFFSQLALQHGVEHASRTAQHRAATLEDPGFGGYGRRRTWTTLAVQNLLRVTHRTGTHIAFTTHEDRPDKDKEGNVVAITMMLGSDLPEVSALQISEVWFMHDNGQQRKIAVRPVRARKPMKTRMFLPDKPEFVWNYNALTGEGDTLAKMYERWEANGFNKIPTP